MSRLYTRLVGTGAGLYFASGDKFKLTPHGIPLQYNLELMALGSFCKNHYIGGDWDDSIDGSVAGDFDLIRAVPFIIDNTNSQLSGATNLVCRIRYYVRVSNAAVSVTPKIVYGSTFGTITTAATLSGQSACTATATDFSGTASLQTVLFTIPAGLNYFKAQVTVGGIPAAGYEITAFGVHDLYIND